MQLHILEGAIPPGPQEPLLQPWFTVRSWWKNTLFRPFQTPDLWGVPKTHGERSLQQNWCEASFNNSINMFSKLWQMCPLKLWSPCNSRQFFHVFPSEEEIFSQVMVPNVFIEWWMFPEGQETSSHSAARIHIFNKSITTPLNCVFVYFRITIYTPIVTIMMYTV